MAFAVTDAFGLVIDTVETSRKVRNLRHNPKIAFAIGGLTDHDERTVQYEGLADEPRGEELERLKEIYFSRFPEGRDRQSWPGLLYIRARPTWIRYSDYNRSPAQIVEFDAAHLTPPASTVGSETRAYGRSTSLHPGT